MSNSIEGTAESARITTAHVVLKSLPMSTTTFDFSMLPSTFLAYPSDENTADYMTLLANEARDFGLAVTTWQEKLAPGYIFESVRGLIEAAGMMLAEITHANPNVLFEFGYAVAQGKSTVGLVNETAAGGVTLGALQPFVRIGYSSRVDIYSDLAKLDLTGNSFADQLGIRGVTAEVGSLYFVPNRRTLDINETLSKACLDSAFAAATISPKDTDYDNFASQAQSIALTDVFVTVLASEDTSGHRASNGIAMLYAGIAAGLGKDYLVLAHQPLKRLLDLGEHLIPIRTESEGRAQLERFLQKLAADRVRNPRNANRIAAPASSALTGLFLGSLDARAVFDLGSYFIETPEYKQAESGRRHLFVGSKGAGKTANFERLRKVFGDRSLIVVSVAPYDFEFPRLAAIFEEHLSLAHWEFVYGTFWRFIIFTEILKEIRAKYFSHLLREIANPYASALVSWLDDNEELLSRDFVSRVTAVLSELDALPPDDQARRQRLEEILQVSRMYEMEGRLKDFFRHFRCRLLIDDLDRNWRPDSESSKHLIVTLLNEIHRLMTELAPDLTAAVFVRKDVYDWLIDHDLELMKRDPGVLSWNQDSLALLIAARIAAHLDSDEENVEKIWSLVFPPSTRGEPTRDFIIRRTLLRPRDVVQFCQKAIENAQRAGRLMVSEADVYDAWEPTGELILSQIEIEYEHIYSGLGDLVFAFFDEPWSMAWSNAKARLLEQAARFGPPPWIQEAEQHPLALVEILYEAGIVGVETSGGSRLFRTDRPFADFSSALQDDFTVVIHPAFHRYFRSLGS